MGEVPGDRQLSSRAQGFPAAAPSCPVPPSYRCTVACGSRDDLPPVTERAVNAACNGWLRFCSPVPRHSHSPTASPRVIIRTSFREPTAGWLRGSVLEAWVPHGGSLRTGSGPEGSSPKGCLLGVVGLPGLSRLRGQPAVGVRGSCPSPAAPKNKTPDRSLQSNRAF